MKVWMRGLAAGSTPCQHFSMSPRLARARPQMIGPSAVPTSSAMRRTAWRSSGEEAGKPGLHHVDAEARELPRDLELLRAGEGRARRLLAIAQSGVEDADAIVLGIWCS